MVEEATSSDEVIMYELVTVSLDDLHSAFVAWLNHHQFDWHSMQQARRSFSRFLLGAPLPTMMGFSGNWELTPEQAHRMRLLLSPHAHTIIKMYHVKQSSMEVPE